MHRVFFLLPLFLSLFADSTLHAQTNSAFSDAFPIAVQTTYHDLEFSRPKIKKPIKSIRNIRVLDYRPDTNRIGVYEYEAESITEELRIRQKFPSKLELMLNEYLSCPNGESDLLIVLRECWVSNFLPLKGVTPPTTKRLKIGVKMMMQLKVDVFEKKENLLYPYLRIDTITYSGNSTFLWGKHKLSDLMGDLVEKLAVVKDRSRKVDGVSEELLHQHYQEPFEFPIFKDSLLKKGVYKSFDEFKVNRPSIEEYKFDTLSDFFMILTKDDHGVYNISRNVWGYCDGTSVYFQIQSVYFPVIRIGRALYVYCAVRPEQRTASIPVIFPFMGAFHYSEILINRKVIKVDGMTLHRIDLQRGHIF